MPRLLCSLVSDYATVRPLSRGAVYLLGHTVKLYGQHLGRVAGTSDLTDEAVSGWIAAQEGHCSPATLAGHRTRLLCLWRFAARRGHCQPPGEVRAARAPDPSPVAWTPEEVGRLLAACDRLGDDGAFLGVLISAAYESGLRKGDLGRVHRDQISTAGVIRIHQHKTGYSHEPRLQPETAAAVLTLPGEYPLRCAWGSKKYSRLWWRARELAGLTGGGGLQQLRRTGATWVAVEEGLDAAREFLGHRSAEMVRHYVDRTFYRPRGHLPPRACGVIGVARVA